MSAPTGNDKPTSPIREIVQPFVDLVHAPRALWGINLGYMLEGLAYFGVLYYLTMHFSEFVFVGQPNPEAAAHSMVGVLTAGITIAMFFLGFVADKKGVRFALLSAFTLLLIGRVLISAAPTVMGLEPDGLWSPLHLVTMGGILLVVVGYGMYQPAAYAAVRKFTTPKTAAMGFAMLYALMNLGGFFPSYAFLLRDDDFLGLGIPGTFWVYTAITAAALVITAVILTRKTVERATESAREETARIKAEQGDGEAAADADKQEGDQEGQALEAKPGLAPVQMWLLVALLLAAIYYKVDPPLRYWIMAGLAVAWVALNFIPVTARWLSRHPLADAKFCAFIFVLIPVQTLFTYNWLVLPEYISRAFEGWIGEYFEIAGNLNPLLVFIAVPIVTSLTQKKKIYTMMVAGTFVMAAPAFLLVIGPYWWTLFPYIVIMTIGEAMWQPRFLQYAAEIAPEGRTGEYMGVAQLPWFLTKVLVPVLYSGWMMDRYCPSDGCDDTQFMWLVFACIAMSSTVLLVLLKGWLAKDFKEKAE